MGLKASTCTGGSICPMTATRLRNPIILQPQSQLRNEIWEFQQRQQESRQRRTKSQDLESTSSDDDNNDENQFWSNEVKTCNFGNSREQEIQYQLARDRIPETPAYPATSLYQAMASWWVPTSQQDRKAAYRCTKKNFTEHIFLMTLC